MFLDKPPDDTTAPFQSPQSPPLRHRTGPGNTIVCIEGSCARNPKTFTKAGEKHTKKHTLPYLCPVDGCPRGVLGAGFYQRRDRNKHRDSHSAAASFRCPVEGCDSTATRDYNMVRHMKDQHKIKIKKADLHASAIVRSRHQR
ncbi:hypothetical protein B0T26DRAFT_647750 [Lasiosphaeria miniovina]|uniref:C2H2-type domain-containing protein n=1 Tax=Lasiosphaeria miniovina TaxID=1954250 RepID=A0AA40DZR7_9PEZI|nr:uncharacterized protein B0T26DRAFT_647750 [Lasiosphaeria miniovina]KAK0717438.1 hypothetical protein B0T26DRAFT_647750 [Lasiosphaeria miniovina]